MKVEAVDLQAEVEGMAKAYGEIYKVRKNYSRTRSCK